MKKILFTIDVNEAEKNEFSNISNEVQIDFKAKKEVTKDLLKEYDALIGNIPFNLLEDTILDWVHLESAGADRYIKLNPSTILTNSSGAYGEAIAEYILAAVFTLYKKFDKYIKVQQLHSWEKLGNVKQVKNSKVCIIGLGDIGKTFAQKIHALGAEVYGVKRNIEEKYEYIKQLYTIDTMDDILSKSDIVVLALPSTGSTKHLFNYKKLKAINKNAILINVGRGDAIVTQDLIKILEEGYFDGVCLDVCDPEPLPINSKLWQFSNVIITPHVSGNYSMEYTYLKVLEIAKINIKNYIDGKPLINVINKTEGY